MKLATHSKRMGQYAILLAIAGVSAAIAQNAPFGGPGGAPGAAPAKPTPYVLSGVYTLKGGTDKSTGVNYPSGTGDVSAIYVLSAGRLTLTDPTIATTADTSSGDNSSFFGLNAAVLATHSSRIQISGGTVSTTGQGANAVFSTGAGTSAVLSKTTINATGNGSHGVMATAGGSMTLKDVTITTTGAHAAAIATDRGGGTIIVTGGTFNTSGDQSPAIYSTGSIKVADATLTASGAEAAVVEGRSTILLTKTDITGQKSRGVMIYQSTSPDTQGTTGGFGMQGGSLTAGDGPLFYVTNTAAIIELTGATLNLSSGKLIDASAGQWGRTGFNGGHVTFTAEGEKLAGDITADKISSIAVKLENKSTLSGVVTNAGITLDGSSNWNVSNDSTVTIIQDSQGINGKSVSNITGNGHDVRYDGRQSANRYLNEKTYNLAGGGYLMPTPGTGGRQNNNGNNGQPGTNGYNNNGGNNNGGGGGGRGGRR